ncbi:MAG: hypothetical protein H6628_02525 [Calditrichae bacterium]|nr:hypothetical protein [Calditrichia bacterium]
MKQRRNINRFILVALAVAVTVLYFLPIQYPYKIDGLAKIVPVREWHLIKGPDGRLMASLHNYERGMTEAYAVSQFERGDAVNFAIRPALQAGQQISAGDTIGRIYSNEIERQLAKLNGELEVATAALAVSTEGEKASVVQEAEQRLAFARRERTEQQKIADRLESLYQQGLASRELFEIEAGRLKLMEINIAIAEAQLQSAHSGAKREEIRLARSQIEALRREIQALERRSDQYVFTSPIDGKIARLFSYDTLLTIYDTTAYIAFMPVEWQNYQYLAPLQAVNLQLAGAADRQSGRLLAFDRSAHRLNGRQVVIAAVLIDNRQRPLAGMLQKCAIWGEPVTIWEYSKRFINSVLRS